VEPNTSKDIMKSGTQVLIFKFNQYGNSDESNFIKGRIEEYEVVSQSIWNITIYKVLGEDGNTYFGTYDMGISNISPKINYYFRSIEDHIKQTKDVIKRNCDKINEINNTNSKLFDILSDLCVTQHQDNEKSKFPIDTIDNEIYNTPFDSLDDKVTLLANLNAKRYRRNKLIVKRINKA